MRTVRLVADPYPPYQYEDAGVIRGMDYDTIRRAFRALPFALNIELHPWDECLRRVDAGTADGVFQITKTAEREARYLFSTLLRTEEMALFARVDGPASADSAGIGPETTGSHVLGVLQGYIYGPAIDAIPEGRKLKVPGQEDLLRALDERRCDLVVMDTGVAEHVAGKLGIADVRRLDGFALKRDLYVAFRPGSEAIVAALDDQLLKAHAD